LQFRIENLRKPHCSLGWFAQDREGNVWSFGENTHELENGLITTIEGSFIAGVDRAKPGIVMKAHPMVGDFTGKSSRSPMLKITPKP
jgi:hypothetical protein